MAPPLTYALLVSVTLLLAPWVLKQARPSSVRRIGFALIGSMVVLEVGLILLYYSLAVCAALATVAILLAVAPLRHPGRWKIAALFGACSAVAGAAFAFARQESTFLVYFGSALPFLFTAAYAFNIASLARWKLDRRVLWPAAGVLSFTALIPVSSFLLFFLQWFEVAHLPITILALISLRRLLRVASTRVDVARVDALGSESVAEFLERPQVSLHGNRLVWFGAGLGTVVTLWQLLSGDVGLGTRLSFVLLVMGGATLGVAGHRNGGVRGALRWGGGVLLLLATLLVLTDAAKEARLGDPVALLAGARLVLGSLAALMVGVGVLSLFARAGDEATRRRWADDAVAVADVTELPRLVAKAGGLCLDAERSLSTKEIDAATTNLERSGARFAVVPVFPTRPGWTIPDAILARLGAARLHVAVVEGMEAFLSPPLVLDGEDD